MKQIYANLSLATGAHNGGICSVQIAPIEWIDFYPEAAYLTGILGATITLVDELEFLTVQMAPDSSTFTEKAKTVKGLPFFDVSISGLLNDLSALQRQQLETLRYSELVCITTDTQGRKRVTGNRNNGLTASFDFSQTNKSDGLLEVGVEFNMQQATLSPFYTG